MLTFGEVIRICLRYLLAFLVRSISVARNEQEGRLENYKSHSFIKAKIFTERKTLKLPSWVLCSSKLNNLVRKILSIRSLFEKKLVTTVEIVENK